ncbi:hypothetical protein JQ575_37055 [Bradyrhizobium sp. JYMT SZCCT0428]|nr:hypothetical protein [Bradyrhizobium sp. JYMT SZCCT0428]
MANSRLRDGSDPGLCILAHAIRHEQQGEIALMHGVSGENAVAVGFRNTFADNVNPANSWSRGEATELWASRLPLSAQRNIPSAGSLLTV